MEKSTVNATQPLSVLLAVSLLRGLAGPGLNSSLGVFFPSVSSLVGASVGELSWSVSIASLAGMLFLPAAPRLFARLGVRITALLGVLLVSLSYLALAFASHIIWWYLLAIPFGIGTVLIVNLLGPLILSRTARALGASLGWMMTLAGLVAIPVQPLLRWLITGYGARMGYFVLGGVTLAWMLLCVCFLPQDSGVSPPCHADVTRGRMSLGVLLPVFVILAVIVAFNALHQHMTMYAQSLRMEESAIVTALFLSMLGAALGGVVIGAFTHAYGGCAGGYMTMGIGGGSILLFLFSGGRVVWFCVACLLHGVASAAIGITAQTLVGEYAGDTYDRMLSCVLTAIPLATILATPLWGMLYDRSGSYTPALWGILALLAVGVGCLFVLGRKKKPHRGRGRAV